MPLFNLIIFPNRKCGLKQSLQPFFLGVTGHVAPKEGIYGEPPSLGSLLGGMLFRVLELLLGGMSLRVKCVWVPGRLGFLGISSHK